MADYRFPHRHLLGIEGLNRLDIETLLELGDRYVELPCCGVFEMQAGKIKVWRDYFDLDTYMKAVANEQ